MARPKRSEADAYDRISTAFWDLLAEKPFEKITIVDLSKKAAVNHNLIYYYFENLYDMAEKLFKANQAEGQVQMIIQAVLGNADSSKKSLNSLICKCASTAFGFLCVKIQPI